jgi:hypothetical protein
MPFFHCRFSLAPNFKTFLFLIFESKKIIFYVYFMFFQIITCQKIRSPLSDNPGKTLNEDKLIGNSTTGTKRLNRNEVCVRHRPTQG